MSAWKKLTVIALFIVTAYSSAWLDAYRQSSAYFQYAQEQQADGEWVTVLKGMNKLELRLEDPYLGGYQQVIETWESSILGPQPDFYRQALASAENILPKLTDQQLLDFIEIYIQLDIRYVPEAAAELLKRAKRSNNQLLVAEMSEFLQEAFPEFSQKAVRQ